MEGGLKNKVENFTLRRIMGYALVLEALLFIIAVTLKL